ncbi:MAG: argininosuccinate lyase [Crenarchaeota archaeon]|nr:argininosuccinate lyase [Thermoproteota archaeon]
MGYRSYAMAQQPRWLAEYISSLSFDKEICPYVLDVLAVHVRELERRGFIKSSEKLLKLIENFDCTKNYEGYEDIHEAIEYYLISASEEAKQINLGKSRNDQVATAIRLRTREEILDALEALYHFIKALYVKAKRYRETFFPTFTHLQPAQPGSAGLYFSSFAEELVDSFPLLVTALKLTDKCPLGAAAAAGSTVPLGREERCSELCFEDLALNALYATTSRAFALASASALLALSLPLTRFAEDMFIFSSPSFGLVKVPEDHAGTSSIMPHKRNPATLEVARAELSKLIGILTFQHALLKGLPSGYSLDLQQMTPSLWRAFSIFRKAALVLADFTEKLELDEAKAREFLRFPLQAADLAERLAVRGVPFRDAYARVARELKKTQDVNEIALKILGEPLGDPLLSRRAPGAPGNLEPVFEKIYEGIERILFVLQLRYKYQNCPNS